LKRVHQSLGLIQYPVSSIKTISLARKETYRHKHSLKIQAGGEGEARPERKERIPLDPVIKQVYEEGKCILINKPLHWTSFDVVRKLRSILQIKKIGHAGTLDPLATGLLIVCTGKFTKKINEFMAQEKEYTGTFILGAVTPTYDLESEPEQHKDFAFVTKELLEKTTHEFTGDIEQYAPMFSAIKKDGVALYELARKGIDVQREARKVKISSFEITGSELPVVHFKVVCSTGTYIRSLANDFGSALGCGAYLGSLCRTRIGQFTIEDSAGMEEFEQVLVNQ